MAQLGELYYNLSTRGEEKVIAEVTSLTKQLDKITSSLKPIVLKLNTRGISRANAALSGMGVAAGKAAASNATLEKSTSKTAAQLASIGGQAANAANGYKNYEKAALSAASSNQKLQSSQSGAASSSKALGTSADTTAGKLKGLQAVIAQLRATLGRLGGGFDDTSKKGEKFSVVGSAVRSSLLTIGFAANNTVAGMALITGGFAAANAGGRALLATLGILAPIIAFGAAVAGAAKQVTSLEEAQVSLAKVGLGAGGVELTTQEIEGLTDSLQDLSREIGISTQDLLGISAASARLGVQGIDQIEKFTKTIADLSVATDIVGDRGAEQLAKFLAVTGTATTALGDTAFEVGNILNELGNRLPTTAARVLDFTRFTGQLGALTGVTREQILGLSAGLDSLGITAEGAGNPLNKLFSDIQKAARKGGDALDAYVLVTGKTTEEFSDLIQNSPIDAFLEIARGLNEIKDSGASVNLALDALGVTEQRQTKLLRQAAGGYEKLAEAIAVAEEEAAELTSTEKEVERATATLGNNVRELGQNFAVISQDLGQQLLPAFQGIIGGVTALTDAFIALDPPLRNAVLLFGPILALVTKFGGPAGVAVTAALGVTQLAKSIGDTLSGSAEAAKQLKQLSDNIDGIQNPSKVTQEAIDRLAGAEGTAGLNAAVTALGDTLDGPGKKALETYAETAINTASTTVEAIDSIFRFLAIRQADALRLSIQNAKAQQALITSQLQEANKRASLESTTGSQTRAGAIISAVTAGPNRQSLVDLDEKRIKLQDSLIEKQAKLNELTQDAGNERAVVRVTGSIQKIEKDLAEVNSEISTFNEGLADGALVKAQAEFDEVNQKITILNKQLEAAEGIATEAFSGDQVKAAYKFSTQSVDDFTEGLASGAQGTRELRGELDTLFENLTTPANTAEDVEETAKSAEEWEKALEGAVKNNEEARRGAKRIKGEYEKLTDSISELEQKLKDAATRGESPEVLQAIQEQINARKEQLRIIDETIAAVQKLGSENTRSLEQIGEDLKSANDQLQRAVGDDAINAALDNIEALEDEKKAVEDVIEQRKLLREFSRTAEDQAALDQIFDTDELDSLNRQLSDTEGLIRSLATLDTSTSQQAIEEYVAEWERLRVAVESVGIAEALDNFQQSLQDRSIIGALFGDDELDVAQSQLGSLRSEIERVSGQISSGDFTTQGLQELTNTLGDLTNQFSELDSQVQSLLITDVLDTLDQQTSSNEFLAGIFGTEQIKVLEQNASAVEGAINKISSLIDDGTISDPAQIEAARAAISGLAEDFRQLESAITPEGSLAAFNDKISQLNSQLLRETDTAIRASVGATIRGIEQQKAALEAALNLGDIDFKLSTNLGGIDSAESQGFADILFGESELDILNARLSEVGNAVSEAQAIVQSIGQADASVLQLAQGELAKYIAQWRELKEQIEAVEFPAGSIAALDREIAEASESVNKAQTDSTRLAAQERLNILEDEREKILDDLKSLGEQLSDLVEEQGTRLSALVTQAVEGLGGVTFAGARATANAELANLEAQLQSIQNQITAAGGLDALDLDDPLFVTFQSVVEQIDNVRGSLESLNSAELDDLNDELSELTARIDLLGDISASDLGQLVSARQELQTQVRELEQQLSNLPEGSDDFERLEAELSAVNSALEGLPTGFENVADSADQAATSITNTFESFKTLLEARDLGITISGLDLSITGDETQEELSERLLTRSQSGIEALEGLEKALEAVANSTQVFSGTQDFAISKAEAAQQSVDALKSALQELANAGIVSDEVVGVLTQRLDNLSEAANNLPENLIKQDLKDLQDLEKITPELAESLAELGSETENYEEALGRLLPILRERLAALKAEDTATTSNKETVDALTLSIAKLEVQYDNLVNAGIAQYNSAVDLATAKNRILGSQFDLVGARLSAVTSAIDANLQKQLAQTGIIDLNDEALQELISTLKELQVLTETDATRGFREELEFTKELTDRNRDSLAELGIETRKISEISEDYRRSLQSQIDKLREVKNPTQEVIAAITELQLKIDAIDVSESERQFQDLKNTLDSITRAIQAVGDAVSSLLDIDFDDGNSIIAGLQGIAGAASAIPGPVGAIAGAVSVGLGVVNSVIGDLSNGMKQVRKEIEGINQSLNFIDASGLVELERVSRGGISGLFGGRKTQIDQEASEFGLSLAESIDSGFTDGLKGGLATAIDGGDTLKELGDSINEVVKSAFVDAIFESLVTQGLIGSAIQDFTEALADGNFAAAKAIFDGIQEGLPEVADEFDRLVGGLGLSMQGSILDAVNSALDQAIDNANLGEIKLAVTASSDDIEAIQDLIDISDSLEIELDLDTAGFDEIARRQQDLVRFLEIVREQGIELTADQLKAINDETEKLAETIEGITGISADSLASVFAGAAGTAEGFTKTFADNFEDAFKQAIINAFVASEAVKSVLDGFSDTINDALADGIVTPEELAAIAAYKDEVSSTGEELDKILDVLGLVKTETQAISGIDIEIADASLDDLFRGLDRLDSINSRLDRGITVEVDGIEVDPEAAKKAAEEISDAIKAQLGTAVSDFESLFSDALTDINSADQFATDWERNIKDATVKGLTAAFILSPEVQAGIQLISDLFTDALRDGVIDSVEQAAIDRAVAQQTERGRRFAESLEDAGLIELDAKINVVDDDLDQRILQFQLDAGIINSDEFIAASKQLAVDAAIAARDAQIEEIESQRGIIDEEALNNELLRVKQQFALTLDEIEREFQPQVEIDVVSDEFDLASRSLQIDLDLGRVNEEEFIQQTRVLAEAEAKARFEANKQAINDLRGEATQAAIDQELLDNANEYAITLQEIQTQFTRDIQDLFVETASFDAAVAKAFELRDALDFTDDKPLQEFFDKLDARIKESLGTTVNDLIGNIRSAFDNSDDVFLTFTEQFGLELEKRTKDALLNAFLEAEFVQTAIQGLSDVITEAVADRDVSREDIGAIQLAQSEIQNALEPIFESLGSIDILGQSARNTAAEQERLREASRSASDELDSFSQSISNAPTGFKIERFIQQAVNPQRSIAAPLTANVTRPLVIQQGDVNVTVQGDAIGINDLDNRVRTAVTQQNEQTLLERGLLT